MQGWGMTETSPMGTIGKGIVKYEHLAWSDEQRFENVAVAGIPVAGIEVKIVDCDDVSKELPANGIAQGELLVVSPPRTKLVYLRMKEWNGGTTRKE